jgi:hypothetical protein
MDKNSDAGSATLLETVEFFELFTKNRLFIVRILPRFATMFGL